MIGAFRLKRIGITDFGSYGDVHLDLDPNGLYLIRGVNVDDSGTDSNGAGKTTLYRAITWAIFGRTPDGGLTDDVIRVGRDACLVDLEFESGFRIVRSRTRGKSAALQITVDGKVSEPETATPVQEQLNQYFCLDPSIKKALDDFVSSVFLFVGESGVAGGKLTNTTSVVERMDAVTRYLRLGWIDAARTLAGQRASTFRAEADSLLAQKESVMKMAGDRSSKQLCQEIDTADGVLAAARKKEKLWANAETKIRGLFDKQESFDRARRNAKQAIVAARQDRDRDLEQWSKRMKSFGPTRDRLGELKDKLAALEPEAWKKERASMVRFVEECEGKRISADTDIRKKSERITVLENTLKAPQKCPRCEQTLHVTGNGQIQAFDPDRVQKELSSLRAEVSALIAVVKDNEQREGQCARRINEIDTKQKLYDQILKDIQVCRMDLKQRPVIKQDRDRIREDYKRRIQYPLEQLKSQGGATVDDWNALPSVLRKKIKLDVGSSGKELRLALRKALKLAGRRLTLWRDRVRTESERKAKLEADLDVRRRMKAEEKRLSDVHASTLKELEKFDFWQRGFANIRRDLIAEFLPALEEQTNQLLKLMSSNMRIEIRLVTPKKDESGLKASFDIMVLCRNAWRELFGLSQGEQTRIGMMLSIALKKLARDNAHSSFGWLMADEVLDTLDISGIQLFLRTLASQPYQVFIISHRDIGKFGALDRPVRTLCVTKKSGISSVEVL